MQFEGGRTGQDKSNTVVSSDVMRMVEGCTIVGWTLSSEDKKDQEILPCLLIKSEMSVWQTSCVGNEADKLRENCLPSMDRALVCRSESAFGQFHHFLRQQQ